MFTGLIEEIGSIKDISVGAKSALITIKGEKVLEGLKIGDSVAVNGVCLTVVSFRNNEFTVDVMAETLRMSNLKRLIRESKVNLERAVAAGQRLGGHIVSGHIDSVGTISEISKEDIATWLTIDGDANLLKYIVYKGSIAVDGVSLTVAEVYKSSFKVSIIPHTKGNTILNYKKVGDTVNLECDIIAKYVEKLMSVKNESKISEDFLKRNGFF